MVDFVGNLPESKAGMTQSMIPIDGGGLLLVGAHSGAGMLQAQELARTGAFDYIATSSKRGRPDAPGPSSIWVAAMQNEVTHYMAQCDDKDPAQLRCLTNWRPSPKDLPAPSMEMPEFDEYRINIDWVKANMSNLTARQLKTNIRMLEDMLAGVKSELKTASRRIGHPQFKQQQDQLEAMKADMGEKEVELMDLIADLTKLLGERPALEGADGE